MRLHPNQKSSEAVWRLPTVKRYLAKRPSQRASTIYARQVEQDGYRGEVTSTDPSFLAFTEDVVSKLNGACPKRILDDGFADQNAVIDNFSAALSVSGLSADPTDTPVVDTEGMLQEEGLPRRIPEQYRAGFFQTVKLLWQYATPSPLHVPKGASTGAPNFITDDAARLTLARLMLARSEEICTSYMSVRGVREVYLDLGVLPLHTLQTRAQPDAVRVVDGKVVSKDRPIRWPEEARRSVAKATAIANKTFPGVPKGHFAMRIRNVWSTIFELNIILSAVDACARGYAYERYAATFKTRSLDEFNDQISGWSHVVAVDVKAMDRHILDIVGDLGDALSPFYDERWVNLLQVLLRAPFVAHWPSALTDEPSDYNPLFGGDPLDPRTYSGNWHGLPSGIAPNSHLGRTFMVFVYTAALVDAGIIKWEEQEQMLLWKHRRVAMKNNGDDCVVLFRSGEDKERFVRALRASKLAVLDIQDGGKFNGNVIFRDHSGRQRATPNVVTYVTNELARERSITEKHPRDYLIGLRARDNVYRRAPCFTEVAEILNEARQRHLGVSLPAQRAQTLSLGDKTPADLEVLSNPRAIHYKVDLADLSPDVRDTVVRSIPFEEYGQHIKWAFKPGVLHA